MKRMFTEEEIRAVAQSVAPELPEALTDLVDVADLNVDEGEVELFDGHIKLLDEDGNGKILLHNADANDYGHIYTTYDDDLEEVIVNISYQLSVEGLIRALGGISLPNGFTSIWDSSGNTLYDEFTEITPTDLTDIPDTFSASVTHQKQLPSYNESSLTVDDEWQKQSKMLYWIKKGYIKDDSTIIKIQSYDITSNSIEIIAYNVIFDSNGAVTSLTQYRAVLNTSQHTYTFESTLI